MTFHRHLVLTTVAAVLLHAILGCCVHHAHARFARAGGQDAAAMDGCCHHVHCPVKSDSGDPKPSDPHDGSPCEELDCQYIVVIPNDHWLDGALTVTWLAVVGETNWLSHDGALRHRSAHDSTSGDLPTPVPLYILKQVWLI